MIEIVKLTRDNGYKEYKKLYPHLDKPGTYFRQGSSGRFKIGMAKKSVLSRLLKARTDLDDGVITLFAWIPTDSRGALIEEQKAKMYFADYIADGEFFVLSRKQVENYIHLRNGQVFENNIRLERSCRTDIGTFDGREKIVKFRPRCYFYPDLPAQITTESGLKEDYRTMDASYLIDIDKGLFKSKSYTKRRGRHLVYISQRKHYENLAERKNKNIKQGTLEGFI